MTDQIDKKKSGALPLIFIGVLVCCLLWGSAFPCIKIGYKLWNIESGDVWSIILIASLIQCSLYSLGNPAQIQ